MPKIYPAYYRVGRYRANSDNEYLMGPVEDYGTFVFNSRRDMAHTIRDLLYDICWPRRLFKLAKTQRHWRLCQLARSASCIHFDIPHKDEYLLFAGLTEDEYQEAMGNEK